MAWESLQTLRGLTINNRTPRKVPTEAAPQPRASLTVMMVRIEHRRTVQQQLGSPARPTLPHVPLRVGTSKSLVVLNLPIPPRTKYSLDRVRPSSRTLCSLRITLGTVLFNLAPLGLSLAGRPLLSHLAFRTELARSSLIAGH